MDKIGKFSFLVLLYLFVCSLAFSQIKYRVVKIADGDTFTVLDSSNHQIRVRLFGIDCPEKGQDFGNVAKQYLNNRIGGQLVFLTLKSKDRYGRSVAIAYDMERNCINELLLSTGLAWHYTHYDKNPQWQKLEINARKKKLGLWKQPNAIAPWEYRHNRKKVTY